MEPRTLAWVAEKSGGRLERGGGDVRVQAVITDTRSMQSGALFVALPGERFDGHTFLGQAFAAGAAAALVSREVGVEFSGGIILTGDTKRAFGLLGRAYREEFSPQVVAVAGSNGKTSTKDLLATVLGVRFGTLASEASFNNDIGVPLTCLRLERGHEVAVFEVGTNHPGELRPLLEAVQPRFGIITSIGREHLEFFHDLDGVALEEGTLAEFVPRDGVLLAPGDGGHAASLLPRCQGRVLTVGAGEGCDVRLARVETHATGVMFHVKTPWADLDGNYELPLLGGHMAMNACHVLAMSRLLGLGRGEIQRGFSLARASKMRLQPRTMGGAIVLDDAYNANADSMAAALETLRSYPAQNRRFAVLGSMAELGAASREAHLQVGRHAAASGLSGLVFIGRDREILAEGAREGGFGGALFAEDHEHAARLVAGMVGPGDVVLVKASRSSQLEKVVSGLDRLLGRGGER